MPHSVQLWYFLRNEESLRTVFRELQELDKSVRELGRSVTYDSRPILRDLYIVWAAFILSQACFTVAQYPHKTALNIILRTICFDVPLLLTRCYDTPINSLLSAVFAHFRAIAECPCVIGISLHHWLCRLCQRLARTYEIVLLVKTTAIFFFFVNEVFIIITICRSTTAEPDVFNIFSLLGNISYIFMWIVDCWNIVTLFSRVTNAVSSQFTFWNPPFWFCRHIYAFILYYICWYVSQAHVIWAIRGDPLYT
jgi:hypothetical protein